MAARRAALVRTQQDLGCRANGSRGSRETPGPSAASTRNPTSPPRRGRNAASWLGPGVLLRRDHSPLPSPIHRQVAVCLRRPSSARKGPPRHRAVVQGQSGQEIGGEAALRSSEISQYQRRNGVCMCCSVFIDTIEDLACTMSRVPGTATTQAVGTPAGRRGVARESAADVAAPVVVAAVRRQRILSDDDPKSGLARVADDLTGVLLMTCRTTTP